MPVLLPGDPWAFYQGSFQNNNSHVLSDTRNDLYNGNLRPNRGTSPHLGDDFGKAEFSEVMAFYK